MVTWCACRHDFLTGLWILFLSYVVSITRSWSATSGWWLSFCCCKTCKQCKVSTGFDNHWAIPGKDDTSACVSLFFSCICLCQAINCLSHINKDMLRGRYKSLLGWNYKIISHVGVSSWPWVSIGMRREAASNRVGLLTGGASLQTMTYICHWSATVLCS